MSRDMNGTRLGGLRRRLLAWVAALVGWMPVVDAEPWPQWRGPRGDGTSLERNVPRRWSSTEGLAWRTPVPGEGHSSPAVWGEAIFVTTSLADTGERCLLRLDAGTGRIVWQRVVFAADREAMHRENSPASSSPVTDGERVYTSFQRGDRVGLQCHDFDGKPLWSIQPLAFQGEHGYSYTPLIHGDLLIFDCRQEGEAAVLGIDKRTGAIRWRSEPSRRRISHVTPLLVRDGTREQVVVCGSDEMRGLNPVDGSTLWFCKGPSDVAVAGLSFGEGMVFSTAGYPAKTRMAVKVSGAGEVTASEVAWQSRRQVSYVPSPVYDAGHLYTVLDDGILCCFDVKTGDAVWEHRLSGRYRTSLLLAEGHVHATNDQGLTTVFAADSRAYRPVATNDLAEFCYATPAISGSRIYARTGKHLVCIGPAGR